MDYNNEKLTITTDRLILRLFEISDAEKVVLLCNNENIYKNTLYLPYPYQLKDAETWIKAHYENFVQDKSYEFAVTDKKTGELYGAIALSNNKSFNHGELAYWIGERYWGKGYATEAAKAMLQFAFNEKKLHKVYARYFSTNPASGKVMEKLGMVQEGFLKDHVIKDGEYMDLVYFGILNMN